MRKKKSKLIAEFKTFALRGNVIDLAVGVIIGGAFQKIVTSLVNDIIMPVVGLLMGGLNLNDYFFALDGNTYATAELAKAAGAGVFTYGSFISGIIDFFIMAFIIFLLVKAINMLRAKRKNPEEESAPTTKICPFCKSEIDIEASRCPHCTSVLDQPENTGSRE